MTGRSHPPDLLTDDDWDFLQLARNAFWKDAFKTLLHPFQRFAALSYVWGSPETPKNIIMDGRTRFWVTNNLYDALKSLRRPEEARALWIDAVCINQDDPDEKALQIGLMRRIYKQAHEVLAYIPQTPEDNQDFGNLVSLILKADRQCRDILNNGPISEQTPHENDVTTLFEGSVLSIKMVTGPLKPTGTCIEDHGLPAEDDPIWNCWRHFFASPYFRRIWILQEYALAKRLYFQLGHAQCESDHMLLVLDSLDRRSRLLNAKYMNCDDLELSKAAARGWVGFKRMVLQRAFTQTKLYKTRLVDQSLIQVLRTGMAMDATNPRDKLYGLLGLVSDADDFMDLVSYKESDGYPEIYRRFARRFVEKGNLTELLRMAFGTQDHAQMPTWVPVGRSLLARGHRMLTSVSELVSLSFVQCPLTELRFPRCRRRV